MWGESPPPQMILKTHEEERRARPITQKQNVTPMDKTRQGTELEHEPHSRRQCGTGCSGKVSATCSNRHIKYWKIKQLVELVLKFRLDCFENNAITGLLIFSTTVATTDTLRFARRSYVIWNYGR